MTETKKLQKSLKIYIRREKSRIRREWKDLNEQKEQIARLYERISALGEKKQQSSPPKKKVVKEKKEEPKLKVKPKTKTKTT